MKILFVDSMIRGHHLTYLNALLDECGNADCVELILPDGDVGELDKRENVRITRANLAAGINGYWKWMQVIYRAVLRMKPDIVHFLYGDSLTRYFGLGLPRIARRAKIVVTQHQIRHSRLRNLSLRRISHASAGFVVHTEKLYEDMRQRGVKHVNHIEYPFFGSAKYAFSKQEACHMLGMDDVHSPILLALGGTRYDKGLDILLDALASVKPPFHLLVAGREEHFKKAFIEEKISTYSERVRLMLQFLDEEQFEACLQAADIVVLPYRRVFDGASGPLGEAVKYGKRIIAPDTGSLAQIMQTWHLGDVFECENSASLARSLTQALQEDWTPDEKYKEYRAYMSPVRFRKEYRGLYERILKEARP